MHYALFDTTGNLIESYDREDEAQHALREIVDEHGHEADRVALMAFDDEGMPIGEPIHGANLHHHGVAG